MKNLAAQRGGHYVQIFTLKEPHSSPGCYVNEYVISGTLFKKTSNKPSPIPMVLEKNLTAIEKLRQLKSLLDENIITKEEFEKQKSAILAHGL